MEGIIGMAEFRHAFHAAAMPVYYNISTIAAGLLGIWYEGCQLSCLWHVVKAWIHCPSWSSIGDAPL